MLGSEISNSGGAPASLKDSRNGPFVEAGFRPFLEFRCQASNSISYASNSRLQVQTIRATMDTMYVIGNRARTGKGWLQILGIRCLIFTLTGISKAAERAVIELSGSTMNDLPIQVELDAKSKESGSNTTI